MQLKNVTDVILFTYQTVIIPSVFLKPIFSDALELMKFPQVNLNALIASKDFI